MRRTRDTRRPVPVGLAVAAAVFALIAAPAAVAQGRVTGVVTDDEGRPVRGLALRFVTTVDGAEREAVAETDKKGRFGARVEQSGEYRLELPGGAMFVDSAEVVVKTADGLTVSRVEIKGHPVRGLPGLRLSERQDTELTLVAAPLDGELARKRALAFASPELNALADRYLAGETDEVLAGLDALLAENAGIGEAHYLRALALRKLGRTDEAEGALVRALELIPEYPGIEGLLGAVRLDRADALREAGRADDAAALYAVAAGNFAGELERDPTASDALVNRAAALERAGDVDALIPALEALIASAPEAPEAYLRLASAHSRRGEHDLAMATLQRVPADDPRAAVTVYNIAARQYNEGEFAAAALAAQRAAEIDPGLAPAHRLLGECRIAQGDPTAAIPPLERFLELAPADDPDVATYRALLDVLRQQ